MKHFLQKIAILFIVALAVTGCKSTDQKIGDFVRMYNQAAPSVANEVITSTSAKSLPNHIVRIEFVLAMTANDPGSEIQKQMLPAMAKGFVQSERTVKDLIDEGVTFQFALLSLSETTIKEINIDKKEMDELFNGKSAATAAGNEKHDHLSSQMQQMLSIMNQSLPIVDKENGTKITKIDINPAMELVYTVEVDQDLADGMKNETLRAMMKEEMLRGGDAQRVLNGVVKLGIHSLKYIYIDSKGKVLNEVVISQKDFN